MSDPISQLLNACESGDLDTIKSILGPSTEAENEDGASPLEGSSSSSTDATKSAVDAVEEGEEEEKEEDYGASSDDSDDDFGGGHGANGFFGDMRQLRKPTTEVRDRWKITPLGAAIMGRQLEAINLLVTLGANVNGVIENSSLVHYTCAMGGIGGDSSQAFAEACVKRLVEAGARVDARDEFLRTPLHIAAAGGLTNLISMLCPDANHANVQDNRGQTALHVGCRSAVSSRHAMLQALITCGASKEIADHRGRTASHHSAEIGDEIGMKLCLVAAGGTSKDGLGRTAIDVLTAFVSGAKDEERLKTLLVYPHQSVDHKTAVSIARGRGEPPPENEQRIHVLTNGKIGTLRHSEFDGRVQWDEKPPRASIADILRVHDHLYVNMVKTRCEGCTPVDEKPPPRSSGLKDKRTTQLDMDTIMSKESYEAAMYAAGAACRAVDGIMAGECRNAFCVVRPPGHHAGPRGIVTCEHEDPDGGSHGFCLFNNVAVAAAYARHVYRHRGIQRVAILDFDVHHGNGTEALVRNLEPTTVTNKMSTLFGDVTMESPSYKPWLDEDDSSNVFFCSMHGYGHGFYPSSGRTGSDRPVFNVGWPLCKDKDQASREWRQAWRNAVIPALIDFQPDMIFLSCGLDGHRKDEMNHGFVSLQETDYEWLTQQVVECANVHCEGRIVSCLEGGYRIHGNVVSAFARSAAAHVRALASPGKWCSSTERVAFDATVDEEVAARAAEAKRVAEELRNQIEEKELEELRARMAKEEQRQLAILEAEANGQAPPAAPSSPSPASSPPSSSSSSSSSSSEAPAEGGRSRRGRGSKVDYVALAARIAAEKKMAEKKKNAQ